MLHQTENASFHQLGFLSKTLTDSYKNMSDIVKNGTDWTYLESIIKENYPQLYETNGLLDFEIDFLNELFEKVKYMQFLSKYHPISDCWDSFLVRE